LHRQRGIIGMTADNEVFFLIDKVGESLAENGMVVDDEDLFVFCGHLYSAVFPLPFLSLLSGRAVLQADAFTATVPPCSLPSDRRLNIDNPSKAVSNLTLRTPLPGDNWGGPAQCNSALARVCSRRS